MHLNISDPLDRNNIWWNTFISEFASEDDNLGQRIIRAHNMLLIHLGSADLCVYGEGPLHSKALSHITYPAYWALNQMNHYGEDICSSVTTSRQHLILNIFLEILKSLRTDQDDSSSNAETSLGFTAFGHEHVLSPELSDAIKNIEERANIFYPPLITGVDRYLVYEPFNDFSLHFSAMLEAGISLRSWCDPEQKNWSIHFVTTMNPLKITNDLSDMRHFRSRFGENDDAV